MSNNTYVIEILKSYQTDPEHLPQIINLGSPTHYCYLSSFVDKISNKQLAQGYKTKYNLFKEIFIFEEKYINNNLSQELNNYYKSPLDKINEILQSIKNNKMNNIYIQILII